MIFDHWAGSSFFAVAVGISSSTVTLSPLDRKSTRLNSSHQIISYAVFCLKKKKTLYEPVGQVLAVEGYVRRADDGHTGQIEDYPGPRSRRPPQRPGAFADQHDGTRNLTP